MWESISMAGSGMVKKVPKDSILNGFRRFLRMGGMDRDMVWNTWFPQGGVSWSQGPGIFLPFIFPCFTSFPSLSSHIISFLPFLTLFLHLFRFLPYPPLIPYPSVVPSCFTFHISCIPSAPFVADFVPSNFKTDEPGFLLDHPMYQDVIDINEDGISAKGRFRCNMQAGLHESVWPKDPNAKFLAQWWEGKFPIPWCIPYIRYPLYFCFSLHLWHLCIPENGMSTSLTSFPWRFVLYFWYWKTYWRRTLWEWVCQGGWKMEN